MDSNQKYLAQLHQSIDTEIEELIASAKSIASLNTSWG